MQQNLYNEQRKLFAAPDIEHCQDWCQKYILHGHLKNIDGVPTREHGGSIFEFKLMGVILQVRIFTFWDLVILTASRRLRS